MRRILVFVIIAMAMNSCKPEPKDLTTSFTIENTSSHHVELTIYNGYFDYVYKDTTIQLGIDSNVHYKYINIPPDSPFGGYEDSAVIVFDNLKQIIYRRNDSQPRSILNIENFTGGKVKSYSYDYQYGITNEDYLNASEIK